MLIFLKKYKFALVGFILFSTLFLTISYYLLKPKDRLPFFNPSDVNPELVDSTVQHISKFHTIANFSFTNQNGETITQENYQNKIYVADFFFTTCPTICPIMQNHMVLIQNEFKNNSDVMLLSHTVMPDIDSVPVLKKYALEKGIIDSKWNLVTGDKKDIFYMARKSYLAVKTETVGELYDMVHTENFILIDKDRRIRGFYDGTNPKEINQLIKDIKILLEDTK